MADMVMGQLGGQAVSGLLGGQPADALGDPILAALSATPPPPFDPYAGLPDELKPGYMPPMDAGVWREIANADQERHRDLVRRFSRDLRYYRQRDTARPPDFDPKREVAFPSATLSNIINKLTNMAAPLDLRFEVPFKDEHTKNASQIVENWYSYLRKCEKLDYAGNGGGGDLQWDEFFYFFLYGRCVVRILPKETRPEHPFQIDLLDPATVFPVWGGSSEGLVRLTHRRQMSAIDVLSTYLPYEPNLYEKMQTSVAEDLGWGPDTQSSFYHVERELIECWNTWEHATFWGDVQVANEAHKLGYVPFVPVIAKGEPRGMTTPEGKYWGEDVQGDPEEISWAVSEAEDMAEKGVSVFHHIIKTNRLVEIVHTILLSEVLKARNPPTINYRAPQMMGKAPPPLVYGPGGNNTRTLNAERVEIAPTSPHPTDTSPVLGKLTGDLVQGSINPAMYGEVEGSNIAGFAIESMIAAAKDTILPYLRAFEIYQALKAKMQFVQYRDILSKSGIMAVPMDGKYGSSPTMELTPDILAQAGEKVTCEIIGVSDQQLPMLVNAAGAAVERGFWSRRKAMEKLGEKDPGRMIQDIIIERALEHPEMMENFLIPINLIRSGQKDLADLWVLMVVMPKVQLLMAQMMGGAAQGAMAGVQQSGASPGGMMLPPGGPGGPGINGQSNPMVGRDRGRPTGPQPGQGRGAAPLALAG
jgi:hypothetical protein